LFFVNVGGSRPVAISGETPLFVRAKKAHRVPVVREPPASARTLGVAVKRAKLWHLVVFALLWLAACVPVHQAPPSVVLPRVADDTDTGAPPATAAHAGGAFAVAYRDQQVAVRGHPTMALLLSDKRRQRNAALCAAVEADAAAAAKPTLYLLSRRASPQARATAISCRDGLADYDYYRAGQDLAQYGLGGAVGPVVIAYSGRRSRDLVWDLSGFADADLARALAIWRREFPAPPEPAQRGWQTAAIDHAIRASFPGKHLAENQLPHALERKPLPPVPPVAKHDAKPAVRKAHLPRRPHPTTVAAQAKPQR